MMTYLLNSTLCLGLFFAFYHFLLSYEKMHVFNRVYLIGSILLSAGIPLLSFTTGEVLSETFTDGVFLLQPIVFLQEKTASESGFWQQSGGLLRISYSLITAVLLFRFLRNILAIQKQIKQNTKRSYKNAQLVLLDKRILPYTFMQYIFLDKEAYDENKIEEDLLLHELAHVKQKHSVDLFFIELLKVFFWFNPIFYFYQKAIQLNHEFLADDAVISISKNITDYQYLLLNKVSLKKNLMLTSNFNFSLTKKRFIMMTKKSSDLSILLKKLTLIPLMLSFVFLFSQKVIAQTTDGISSEEMKTYTKMMTKAKDKGDGTFIIHKKTIGKLSYLYGNMSEAQREAIEKQGLSLPPPPPPPPAPAPRVYKDNPAAGNVPPPPPPPMSPYQYSKKMAKEGATFFYEGKSISSEAALKILKNNEHINISISEKDGKLSVIKLSKAAIQIED